MIILLKQLSTIRKPNIDENQLLITFYYSWLLWKSKLCFVYLFFLFILKLQNKKLYAEKSAL